MEVSWLVFFNQVVEYNSLSYSSEDMSEDEDSGLDKESEDDGSDSETEIMEDILSDSCEDMSEEEQHTLESGFVQPNSSSDVLVEYVICEMHAGSSEDNEDGGSSDEVMLAV
jgi:DNA-directed RNA polymerase specialized sigma subunit